MVRKRPHGEFEGYLIRMVERKPYRKDCKQVMGHGEVVNHGSFGVVWCLKTMDEKKRFMLSRFI